MQRDEWPEHSIKPLKMVSNAGWPQGRIVKQDALSSEWSASQRNDVWLVMQSVSERRVLGKKRKERDNHGGCSAAESESQRPLAPLQLAPLSAKARTVQNRHSIHLQPLCTIPPLKLHTPSSF